MKDDTKDDTQEDTEKGNQGDTQEDNEEYTKEKIFIDAENDTYKITQEYIMKTLRKAIR